MDRADVLELAPPAVPRAPACAPKLRAAGSARKSSVILSRADRRPNEHFGSDGGDDLIGRTYRTVLYLSLQCR